LKNAFSILLLLIGIFLPGFNLYAQEKTTILTRKVEKRYALKKNPRIFINTERGMISIKTWDSSAVKVTLKLVSKNLDAKIAREELDLMNYAISELRNTVFVSNRMILTKPDQQISSVVRAEYEIFVPVETQVNVNNRFGKLEINGLKGGIFGELYYSDIAITESACETNLHISTGDLTCTGSMLNGFIFTRHSNMRISETGGILRMETEYGNLQLEYGKVQLRFNLQSDATDISVDHKLGYPLELLLSGTYCPLKINANSYTADKQFLKSDYVPNKEQERWNLKYIPPDKATRLIINARFGSIIFL
jgi:hypothetical protein